MTSHHRLDDDDDDDGDDVDYGDDDHNHQVGELAVWDQLGQESLSSVQVCELSAFPCHHCLVLAHWHYMQHHIILITVRIYSCFCRDPRSADSERMLLLILPHCFIRFFSLLYKVFFYCFIRFFPLLYKVFFTAL